MDERRDGEAESVDIGWAVNECPADQLAGVTITYPFKTISDQKKKSVLAQTPAYILPSPPISHAA